MNYISKLVSLAIESQGKAYVPYSNYKVGAAVLTLENEFYSGCNIENAAYSPTVCAERVAIFKAISNNHTKIKKIAIVGKCDSYTYPCGVCRQVIREFCTEDCEVIIVKNVNEYKIHKFSELFPHSFGVDDL